jgi:hypothetical protein
MKASSEPVTVVRLEPTAGLCLRNIHTNEVFEGTICLAKSLTPDDFEEITHEEYERILKEQADAYNAQFINEEAGDNSEV